MSKDTTKNLVGQPVFKQIINILPKEIFDQLVIKFQADRYYKKLFSWEQLITLLFGILSRCDSMGEICDSMRALGGKLNYLNLDCSPSKSTAGDALRNRNNGLYKELYFALLEHFRPFLSVSSEKKYLGYGEYEDDELDGTYKGRRYVRRIGKMRNRRY